MTNNPPPPRSRHAFAALPIGIRSQRNDAASRVVERPTAPAPYREFCSPCGRVTVGVLFCARCDTARPVQVTPLRCPDGPGPLPGEPVPTFNVRLPRVSDDEEPWDANQIRSAYP